jgi:hypothetical protein
MEVEGARRKADPMLLYPCTTCRHRDQHYDWECRNRLVIGFDDKAVPGVDWQVSKDHFPSANWPTTQLCGLEKALWEPVPPKLTRWQRFIAWLEELFA